MTKEGISAAMKNQILLLLENNHSIRKISLALKVSRKTIRKYAQEKQQTRDQERQQLMVQPQASEQSQSIPKSVSPSWEAILCEYAKGKTTAKQLWKEFLPQLSYSYFTRRLKRLSPKNHSENITIIQHYKPGELIEVDYSDGIIYTDLKNGNPVKTQLFCGVLPYSKKVFAEFTHTQRQKDFLNSHNRMFHYFEGVSDYVVVDNLKSGVTKAHRYDPDTNKVYCDYANHMGFAVLPARPRKPRDKACVENAIGVIQRQFYSEIRDQSFYDLHQLNIFCRRYIEGLNAAIMKDYGVSRNDRFEEEKAYLKALPQNDFEIVEYKQAKVHPDCHVQVNYNYYSVPYRYVYQQVTVRISSKILEIFDTDHQSIATHLLLSGKRQFSTVEEHYPENKLSIAGFSVMQAKKKASAIGPHTTALIELLFSSHLPLQYLRRVQGILNFYESKEVTLEAMEYACAQAVQWSKLRLAYIKTCATSFDKFGRRPTILKPVRDSESIYLHQPITNKE